MAPRALQTVYPYGPGFHVGPPGNLGSEQKNVFSNGCISVNLHLPGPYTTHTRTPTTAPGPRAALLNLALYDPTRAPAPNNTPTKFEFCAQAPLSTEPSRRLGCSVERRTGRHWCRSGVRTGAAPAPLSTEPSRRLVRSVEKRGGRQWRRSGVTQVYPTAADAVRPVASLDKTPVVARLTKSLMKSQNPIVIP